MEFLLDKIKATKNAESWLIFLGDLCGKCFFENRCQYAPLALQALLVNNVRFLMAPRLQIPALQTVKERP
jgi:hypothetical protein